MYFSRRKFIKTVGLSGAFLAARFRGLSQRVDISASSSPCFLHTGTGFAPFLDKFLDKIHPGTDAFVTEKYAAELSTILETWRVSFCAATRDLKLIQNLVSETIYAPPFANATIHTIHSNSPVVSAKITFPGPAQLSRAAFISDLQQYLSPFKSIDVAELQISGIQIRQDEPLQLWTSIHYDILGTIGQQQREERTGLWELTWQKTPQGEWKILAWHALGESRSGLKGAGFQDITAACLAGNRSYDEQMQHGIEYWCTTLDGASGIDIYGNNGISVGDYDGDGFDDLYVCQPAGLPNRLYRNRGDGTFEDVTEAAGVGVLDGTSSAIFADLNNSGHQDLIVVRTNGPLLFINRGNGTFEYRPDAFHFAKQPQGTFTAVAVADYDRDGLLDVYFCLYSYYQGLSEYEFPSPYYDAQNGPPNFLLKNHGSWTFEDVTSSSGMNQNNNRYSFACGWNDYNNDGWPDLYVVNDFGRKNLYRNQGNGTFVDVSAEAEVEDPGAGMSVCWFDYDNDGFDDLYVANMWSAAGKRVVQQKQFLPGTPENILRVYRQHANGNSLFHNEGRKAAFRDVTDESGTRLGGWSWSSDALDVDSDGLSDLYVVNGFISGPKKENLSSFFWRQVVNRSLASGGNSKDYEQVWNAINEFIRSDYSWSGYQRNNFYLNNGDGSFTEASGVLGLDFLDDSRSFALADIEHDGRLEIILKNRTSPQIRVLHNQIQNLGFSVSFSLKGTKSNRDAIGAVIEVETPDGRQRSTVRAGSGFLAQHTKVVLFGLGHAQNPLRVTVQWPSGIKQVFEDVPVKHQIHFEEGIAEFKAVPFRPQREIAPLSNASTIGHLPASSESWLVEPIQAPNFKLPDLQGSIYTLADAKQTPLALVFGKSDCSHSDKQLQALQKSWPKCKQNGLGLIAVIVGSDKVPTSKAAFSENHRFSFPILMSDEKTSAVYNIFHRYLYERRRDMELPTSFLINRKGEVVKVYSGFVDPERILKDWLSAPAGTDETARRALPFPGHYFGNGFHHNYFTYGIAFLQYGYLDQALAFFKDAVARNPSYADAYYNIGTIYLNKSQFREARENLEKAVGLDPADADAWNNLGMIYGEQEHYDRALQSFQRAVALRPTYILALQNLVKLYVYQKRIDAAKRVLQKAIAIDPAQPDLHLGLATLLVNENDLAGAKIEFDRVVELSPGNAEALNDLGVVLMQTGDPAGALLNFEACLRVAPDFDMPYLNIALLLKSSGNLKSARDVLSKYLQNHPDNTAVLRAIRELDSTK